MSDSLVFVGCCHWCVVVLSALAHACTACVLSQCSPSVAGARSSSALSPSSRLRGCFFAPCLYHILPSFSTVVVSWRYAPLVCWWVPLFPPPIFVLSMYVLWCVMLLPPPIICFVLVWVWIRHWLVGWLAGRLVDWLIG